MAEERTTAPEAETDPFDLAKITVSSVTSAHASQLPCWIRQMNPSRDLCMYGCPRWCKWFLNGLSV